MADTYFTLEGPSEAVYTDRRSRFLAFARPVESVEQVRQWLKELGGEYFDARHICWAYMLGVERKDFLSSDNGEPSGTAGKPILGQINSLGLTDVAVAVVRYFGGIKLGTPGLIAAYRQSARMALEAGVTVERHVLATVAFHFPYLAMNDVMRVAKKPGVKIVEQQFDNACRMTLQTRADAMPGLKACLEGLDGVTLAG